MQWFGHTERISSEEFVKKVYVSEIEGPSKKGKPLGRWKDRVKEYMSERGATRGGGLEQARRECLDRKRLRLFCHDHLLRGCSWREQDVRAIEQNRIEQI